jgi:hypothetical protein
MDSKYLLVEAFQVLKCFVVEIKVISKHKAVARISSVGGTISAARVAARVQFNKCIEFAQGNIHSE